MKRHSYLLLLAFTLVTSIVNAQFKLNASGKAGMTFPSISGKSFDTNNIVQNETLRHGGYFGLGVELGYEINDKSTVFSGIHYRNMQYKYNIIDLGTLNGENIFGQISFIPNFAGIELPIVYKRSIAPKFTLNLGFVLAYNKLISYSFQGNMPHFSKAEFNDTLNYKIYMEEHWPSFFSFELLYGVSYQINPKFSIAFLIQNGISKTDELSYNVELYYKNESLHYKPSFNPKIQSVYFKLSCLLFEHTTELDNLQE